MIIPLNKKNLFALLVWGLYTLMSYYLFSSVTCFYHLTLFLRFVHVDALSYRLVVFTAVQYAIV